MHSWKELAKRKQALSFSLLHFPMLTDRPIIIHKWEGVFFLTSTRLPESESLYPRTLRNWEFNFIVILLSFFSYLCMSNKLGWEIYVFCLLSFCQNERFLSFLRLYIFEESVYIFQFLNDKMHNYVCQTQHNCEFYQNLAFSVCILF